MSREKALKVIKESGICEGYKVLLTKVVNAYADYEEPKVVERLQLGDVVKVHGGSFSGNTKLAGKYGIVRVVPTSIGGNVGVEFLEEFGGHALDGTAGMGHGYWGTEDELTLVLRGKK